MVIEMIPAPESDTDRVAQLGLSMKNPEIAGDQVISPRSVALREATPRTRK